MSKINELIFVDGITNLSYSTGAFRFDLAAIKPGTQASDDPSKITPETQAHIIMTPQAFIQTAKAMQNFISMVEEKGIIKFSEQGNAHIKADKDKLQ